MINTTQTLFLSHVGIKNTFSEELENVKEPFFELQGIQFVFIKQAQLFFVFTAAERRIVPACALELLR